ncbi:MAG: PilZ domain-containing protein [Candidatus Omnitrophica bacterium]|nr:PilZ domain-containing protein [Candidatus Omnitrophota bacterium]MDE2009742.1 PilZ domain-containing protein [Candidatus Omnitrophota bacterium]MDE2213861.1 PilZ domain-containing protein [Candidatus Omnitrophota bacterium]MDE2231880.1 PilZ domain-containing protein [Candidatus Omnitrophota bacterium]
MTSYEDRRDSVRARRIITVRHRLVKHNNRKIDSIWQLATTENMSLSGLLFVSALPYHPDDVIELNIIMSGVIDIFNGFGKVVRVIRNKGGYHKVAVRYVDLKARRRPAKSILTSTKQ